MFAPDQIEPGFKKLYNAIRDQTIKGNVPNNLGLEEIAMLNIVVLSLELLSTFLEAQVHIAHNTAIIAKELSDYNIRESYKN